MVCKAYMRLSYDFYKSNVVEVAKNLIGKTFVFGSLHGIITETEAYRGSDDEASHAYKRISKRNAMMFGPPGHLYVYMIYGKYYCVNIVTEEAGQASAVLIRGLMLPDIHLNGPGKICSYFNITTKYNGINLISDNNFYLTPGINIENISITTRIGINKAIDKPWRFVAGLI
jgi:DNA-3-methyladenine glycosylase